MFNLDTLRLIKKTFKRFLSLTLIVLIGTGFMMGLLSTPIIMKESVDIFNDENNLQDIQIYSQYGFCYRDVLALMENEDVSEVFASKMVDSIAIRIDGRDFIVRVSELNRRVNKFELVKGRLPESENECLVVLNKHEKAYLELGEHVIIDEKEVEDRLKNNDFLVVGYAYSPEYLSRTLGTSTYKNRDLDTVIYVENTNFISEYYSTIYLTLKGADKYVSYTDKYKTYVEEKSQSVKDLAFEQQNYLKDKIQNEALAELNKNKELFEKEKQEGKEKLDEAAQKLNDANIMIVNYEAEIDLLSNLIYRLESTINTHEDEIEDGGSEIYNYLIDNGLDPSILFEESVQEYAKASLNEAKSAYYNMIYQVEQARKEYDKGMEEYREAVLTYNEEIDKAQSEIKKAEQDLNDLPKAKWTLLDRESHYSSYMYENNCNQMNAIAISLPILFFLVAALVCLTTMTRLVDEQRGQIGIFVALGFPNSMIIMKYVSYALSASLLGGTIGIFIGQAIFPTVIYETWKLMYNSPRIKMVFPINYLLLSIGSFAILMSIVTAYVVNRALKETPALLMRPKAPKNAKEIILEKIQLIWDRLSFTSKITARNLFRYKSRFFMTVIGVAGCTGLLVIGFGVKDSISDVVKIQYGDIFNYNYEIRLENNHHLDENLDVLKNDLDNDMVAEFMSYTSKVYVEDNDDTINALVLDPRNAYGAFNLRSYRNGEPLRLNNDGVIISQKFALNNDIKVGDQITIESKNGVKGVVKVSEICEMYFQHYMFMSDALYQNLFEENIYDTNIAIKNNNIDSLYDDIDKLQDFETLFDFTGYIAQFENMIEALNLIILVIIITAGSLAFVVLSNLTQVNISERIREIATLKVLGFNDHEINLYIFKEILLLSFIGGIIGLPLGVLEHHFIMNVINMEMIMFGMNIKILSFTYSFLITFLFTAIILMFMRKPLRDINMVESLKSVE